MRAILFAICLIPLNASAFVGITFLAWIDLNYDGEINTLDLNIYKQAHRSEPGDPNYNEDCDFNWDDRVDALDLQEFKQAWEANAGLMVQ